MVFLLLLYCQADNFHRFTGLYRTSIFYKLMVLNPVSDINCEHPVKIKTKRKELVRWDCGCFTFMVKVPEIESFVCVIHHRKSQ